MRSTATDRVAWWSVRRSVCLSVTIVSHIKPAELNEMPFVTWTQVVPRNHALDGVQDAHVKGAILRGKERPL